VSAYGATQGGATAGAAGSAGSGALAGLGAIVGPIAAVAAWNAFENATMGNYTDKEKADMMRRPDHYMYRPGFENKSDEEIIAIMHEEYKQAAQASKDKYQSEGGLQVVI